MNDIHGPQYHPRNVVVEHRTGAWCVVDGSYGCEYVARYASFSDAERAAKVRRATIKAALTRRRNKRIARRKVACEAAGVTWAWLTSTLTTAEADAWLGLD
jgi:hypothetical protein